MKPLSLMKACAELDGQLGRPLMTWAQIEWALVLEAREKNQIINNLIRMEK